MKQQVCLFAVVGGNLEHGVVPHMPFVFCIGRDVGLGWLAQMNAAKEKNAREVSALKDKLEAGIQELAQCEIAKKDCEKDAGKASRKAAKAADALNAQVEDLTGALEKAKAAQNEPCDADAELEEMNQK